VSDAQPAPTEEVHRPTEPGLARGLWEAPPYAFYVAFGIVLLFALPYAAYRLGFLRRRPPVPSKRRP
jgi:hypothetical protein